MLEPLFEGPLSWRLTDAMAFLRRRAAFVATPRGWGGIRARRSRQRPPEVHRAGGVGETEKPCRGTSCKESARYDQGTEQRSRVQARTGPVRPGGRRDRGQPPGLPVWAWPFRVLSSLPMALTRPHVPALSAPSRSRGAIGVSCQWHWLKARDSTRNGRGHPS